LRMERPKSWSRYSERRSYPVVSSLASRAYLSACRSNWNLFWRLRRNGHAPLVADFFEMGKQSVGSNAMRKKAKSRSPARLTASRDGCCSTPSISARRYAAGDNVLFIDRREPRPLRLCEGFPRRGPQGFDLSKVLNPLPRSGWKHRNASGKCRTSSSPKPLENSHEIYCRNIRRTFVDPAGHGAKRGRWPWPG
jgi:hypothetical protein